VASPENFVRSPYDDHLGLELVEVGRERVRARLRLDPARHHQPFGIVHGGVWCSIVETLASLGAHTWAAPGETAVGLDNHTSFLRMTRTGTVEAEAVPVHHGRRIHLWTVRIRDESGRLLAEGTCRLMLVAPP
jgi:1,4-dihydroxy-2-naphthoyl-CoA hydrolase